MGAVQVRGDDVRELGRRVVEYGAAVIEARVVDEDVEGRRASGSPAPAGRPARRSPSRRARTRCACSCPRSCTASSSLAFVRATSATRAPSATSCSATARPMPEEAPVTMATLPSRRHVHDATCAAGTATVAPRPRQSAPRRAPGSSWQTTRRHRATGRTGSARPAPRRHARVGPLVVERQPGGCRGPPGRKGPFRTASPGFTSASWTSS